MVMFDGVVDSLLTVLKLSSIYIDSNQLHKQILAYMPHLNKFTFLVNLRNANDLPSNEDIQRSFIEKECGQVGSYVHTIRRRWEGISHVYSLPYQFDYFLNLNNSFQPYIFDTVQYSTMFDIYPFEHEIFQLISKCVPILKELHIFNRSKQINKHGSFSSITFPHLILLDIIDAHMDYAEQFLCRKNIGLPALLNLHIGLESLSMLNQKYFSDNGIDRYYPKIKNIHMKSVLPSMDHIFYTLF